MRSIRELLVPPLLLIRGPKTPQMLPRDVCRTNDKRRSLVMSVMW